MDKKRFQAGPDFPPFASAYAFDFLRQVVIVELIDSPAAQGVGLLDRPSVKISLVFHRSEYRRRARLGESFRRRRDTRTKRVPPSPPSGEGGPVGPW